MAATSGAQTMTNGTARAHGRAPAVRAAAPYDDPLNKVLGLDAKTSGVAAWFGFTSLGTLLLVWLCGMALVVAWWRTLHPELAHHMDQEIEVDRVEAPPPPPPPPAPEPEVKPAAAPPPRATPHEPPPPPPAPAQAAKVITQEPKPEEPVDLTANTFVQGNADAYAGGFTAGNGTNANAVHSMPSPTGVAGGTGAPQVPQPPPPPKVDRTRAASLGGGGEWSCPFPPEADTAQIDEAYVTLQVDVQPDGAPGAVRVMSDPGNGFGREARRCAMGKRYTTALDADGNAVAGTTRPFRVHFSR